MLNKDSHEDKETILSIFKESAANTSVHGISRVVSAKYRYQRVIWLVVVLGLTGYLIVQLSNLIKGYMLHPVQTSVKLRFSTLHFPAVSFCNMNPVRRDAAEAGSSEFQAFINKTFTVSLFQILINVSIYFSFSPWGPGVKSRMYPPYPQRVVKGD